MSKTQDKRNARNRERIEFLIARKKLQLNMFEQAVAIGEKLFEDNRDTLSPQEIEQLEAMRAENNGLLEKVKLQLVALEAELDETNKDPQA